MKSTPFAQFQLIDCSREEKTFRTNIAWLPIELQRKKKKTAIVSGFRWAMMNTNQFTLK